MGRSRHDAHLSRTVQRRGDSRASAGATSPVLAAMAVLLLIFLSGGLAWLRLTAPPTSSVLATIGVGRDPAALAFDQVTGRAFVANSRDNTVSVLDVDRRVLLRTVAVGAYPAALALDGRRGRAFVVSMKGNSVSMLDARSGRLLATTGVAASPQAIAIDERTGRVFVACSGDPNLPGSAGVSVLDAATGDLIRTVQTGRLPLSLAVDERRGRVFVGDGDLSVSMLDAATGRALAPPGPGCFL